MNYSTFVKSNQFQFLQGKPRQWQILLPSNCGLNLGDILTIEEITSEGVPTGAQIQGVCEIINCEVGFVIESSIFMCSVKPSI